MAFSLDTWLDELTQKMTAVYGPQLLYLGIQGSRARGEAGPDSDIDVVVILEQVGFAQLEAYRTLLDTMPHRELACGFLCGRAELAAWPTYDLLQLQLDSKGILGCLDSLLPPLTREALTQAIAIGASTLYHGTCHSFLYGQNDLDLLRELYKRAFFLLRLIHLARGNSYITAGHDLLLKLDGLDKEILALSLRGNKFTPKEGKALYEKLLHWSSKILCAPIF